LGGTIGSPEGVEDDDDEAVDGGPGPALVVGFGLRGGAWIRVGLGEIGAMAVGGELGASEEEAAGEEVYGEGVEDEDQEEGPDQRQLRWCRH